MVIPVLVTDFVATAGASVEAFFGIALAASTPVVHGTFGIGQPGPSAATVITAYNSCLCCNCCSQSHPITLINNNSRKDPCKLNNKQTLEIEIKTLTILQYIELHMLV